MRQHSIEQNHERKSNKYTTTTELQAPDKLKGQAFIECDEVNWFIQLIISEAMAQKVGKTVMKSMLHHKDVS